MKHKKILLLIFLCAFPMQLTLGNDYVSKPSIPEWPLGPLEKQERIDRIEKFIRPHEYSFYGGASAEIKFSTEEIKECESNFSFLKHTSMEDILEPTYIVQSIKDPNINNILAPCAGKLDINREYEPSKSESLDKNSKYFSYYFEADRNLEFYDLSNILGKGYWAFVAEGAIPLCKNATDKNCMQMMSYKTINRIFNTNTCELISLPTLGMERIHTVSNLNKKNRNISYHKTNNFYFFSKKGDSLLLTRYRTNYSNNEECWKQSKQCPMTFSGTDVFVTSIKNPNLSKFVNCTFKPIDIR